MISSTEFRLGNLVSGKDGLQFEITEISNAFLRLNHDNYDIGYANCTDLDYTVLTEEWLLKFGFRAIDKYSFVKAGVFIHHRKIGFKHGKKIIKYVHQLQNVYFSLKDKEVWRNRADA